MPSASPVDPDSAAPVLAADLGGTNMRAAVVDAAGGVSWIQVRPTGARSEAFVDLLREGAAAGGCRRAVIGLPGRIDYRNGRMEHAPNLPASWEMDERALSGALGMPVRLANDADLAAVGEATFGAGREWSDVVYVTLSTGVGAGVLLGGRLIAGARSVAEAGHIVIDRGAWKEGRPSTFEGLASGTALGRLGRERGIDGGGAAVMARMREGDPVAQAVWAEVVGSAAIGITNLCWLFTPEVVVIGGGLGLTGEILYGPVRAHLGRHGPPGLDIQVRGAALGDQAGLKGAAGWDRAFPRPT